jgi:putative membrane protein
VPGVSGGTIALITGIYERLITAVAGLDPALCRQLGGAYSAPGRRQFLHTLRERDVPFLVVLGLGVLTAVVVLSRLVHAAIVGYRAATFAFFFGLIAASAIVLYRHLALDSPGAVAGSVSGFVIAFVVAGATSSGEMAHTLPYVFGTAAVAITAMILPGVSGSFLLLLLGQYEYLTGVLKRFVDDVLVVATGGSADLLDGAVVVLTFGAGAVLGLLTVANVIRWALDHYRQATLAFLVSLMVGSLRLPVREVFDSVGTWNTGSVALVIGAVVVGGGAVLALDHFTADLQL